VPDTRKGVSNVLPCTLPNSLESNRHYGVHMKGDANLAELDSVEYMMELCVK